MRIPWVQAGGREALAWARPTFVPSGAPQARGGLLSVDRFSGEEPLPAVPGSNFPMRRIGMTISRPSVDAPLAGHFGKAKWLLVYEGPGRFELLRNTGLNGRFVAQAFAAHGCTDVILDHAGAGALGHLAAAGLRLWQGPPEVGADELAARLERGELRAFVADPPADEGGGCGCGH